MRRALLRREPSSQSLCIFCSHRLLNGLRPSQNSKRSIHSSRVLSRPPGSAAAAQSSDIEDDISHTSTPSTSPILKNGNSETTLGASSFGSKPVFAPNAPKFGTKPVFGAEGAGTFGAKSVFGAAASFAGPKFGAANTAAEGGGNSPGGNYSLTPKERKAKELIMQKHLEDKRKIELSRQTTPMPSAPTRESQNKTSDRPLPRSSGFPRPDHLRGEIRAEADSRTYNQSPNWAHLQRRQQDSSPPQEKATNIELPAFIRARAQREAQSESTRFVSLSSRSVFGSNQARNDVQAHSQSLRDIYRPSEPPRREYTDSRSESRFSRPAYNGSPISGPEQGAYTPQSRPAYNGSPVPASDQRTYTAPFPRSRSDPIAPGAWRDEQPAYDDRLRRITKAPADSHENDAKISSLAAHSNPDYDDAKYGIYGGGPKLTSTRSAYTGSRQSNLHSPDSRFGPRSNYSNNSSGVSHSQRPPYSDRSDLNTPRPTASNTFGQYATPSPPRVVEPPYQWQGNQSSARYDEMPRGKEKDKARRRASFADDYEELHAQEMAKKELKRQRKLAKAAKKAAALTPILLPEWISVGNLATALKIRLDDFMNKLEDLGFVEIRHDHILGAEDAGLIAQEYGFEPIIDRDASKELERRPPAEDISILPPRPPVVTIMGHVDHGKTTLLDWLRKSSVAASEHGGITQHIGAFSVSMPSGKLITFLDTPGHAAFLSMRQRGANVTDIVILVVAADDSVKPQTIEAINHAKAAKVPIIVAVNKIDKPEANVERVKQDLARHGVEVEDIGGDTQVVCVSGKTGQGMEDLEDAAVTLAEILDMRAETDGQVEGWVIEASLKSMGKVATVLVKRGTLRPGDFIVAGTTWARVRCLRNEAGVEIEAAGPGTPVEIDGWREQPAAGDEVLQAADESTAKDAVDYRLEKEEREKMAADMEAVNDTRKADQERREREKREALIAAGKLLGVDAEVETEDSTPGVTKVYFIIKGDVSGSVEAVIDSVSALGTNEVRPVILRTGVGQLSEFDVEHASAAKGFLINFNTDIDPNIAGRAERAGVKILDHNIIYRLVDDVKSKLSDFLKPTITISVTGEAEVAQIFDINIKGRKQKPIAGCKVRNGVINKASKVKVMRDGEKIFDGTFASLKNVKKDVMEIRKGGECGIGFEGWNDFQVGDLIQCYETLEQKRYL